MLRVMSCNVCARDDLSADVVEVAAAENRSNAHGHGLIASREGDLFATSYFRYDGRTNKCTFGTADS